MTMSTAKLTHEEIRTLRLQLTVPLRDLAMSFLDDPIEADEVAFRVFRELRHANADDVATVSQAEDWLADRVMSRCVVRARRKKTAA